MGSYETEIKFVEMAGERWRAIPIFEGAIYTPEGSAVAVVVLHHSADYHRVG